MAITSSRRHRYRIELGPADRSTSALAAKAAERLLRSAERARDRTDEQAGQALLSRAIELLPEEAPERRLAQVERAHILAWAGRFEEAAALRAETEAAAQAAGDDRALARLALVTLEARVQSDPNSMMRESLGVAEEVLAELERLGDEYGAIWAMRLIGNFLGWLGKSREADRVWKSALERAEGVSPKLRDEIRGWLLWESWWGPANAAEGIARCDEFLEQARGSGSKRFEAIALEIRGVLESWQGSFEEGRADLRAGRDLLLELGDTIGWGGAAMLEADLELGAGDAQAAYETLAEAHDVLREHSETGFLATVVGMRSQAAFLLGRHDEALELADETERVSQGDDFEPLSRLRLVRAQVMAFRGDLERADELVQEARDLIEPTDYAFLYVELHEARANVYRLTERQEEERAALEVMIAAAEGKGNVVAVARAQKRLAEL